MKIKTKIIQDVLIVTCKGTRFDAACAKGFVKFMHHCIQKGHLEIVLDLSYVEFVDSTGLGAIVRCLKELNGRGHLVLCGVNEMVHSLLKMTRLDGVFVQKIDYVAALKYLELVKKKQAVPSVSSHPPPLKSKGFDDTQLSSLSMEDGDVPLQTDDKQERRQFRRIDHKVILNEDIILSCTNQSTGKCSAAVVLDISPGGVLMVSSSKCETGDELLLEGRIGLNFRFSERAEVRNCRDGRYGIEFINPSEKTKSFLQQLTGAVLMGKI